MYVYVCVRECIASETGQGVSKRNENIIHQMDLSCRRQHVCCQSHNSIRCESGRRMVWVRSMCWALHVHCLCQIPVFQLSYNMPCNHCEMTGARTRGEGGMGAAGEIQWVAKSVFIKVGVWDGVWVKHETQSSYYCINVQFATTL